MVNTDGVNGAPAYFFPATFCVIFRDSGRNLHFKNPVKYICNCHVNRNWVRRLRQPARRLGIFRFTINVLLALKLWQRALCYAAAIKKCGGRRTDPGPAPAGLG
jgi:hypothetical protein